ncbi:hypothetical protein ONZ43_g2466 [Nemania bipapillata]|uniref:Uncharacterized protein n=1 Tax=Nemania bipapillata TaxID=110536 RepID=A0ACC2J0I8_9PEZI|nr:hypothetical protein ONZ43_g2466 [Nemania bipapillata]
MSIPANVALAGATGNLGPAILEQLLKAGFHVTILARQGNTREFPDSVEVRTVDYDSVDSLTTALQGQDAIVSTLGLGALAKQFYLIEAAVKANVKRFIPSEFGPDTTNSKTAALAVSAGKVAVQKALVTEAAGGRISYTYIFTGPLLDWCLAAGLILNADEKSIALYDGGDSPFSTTTLASVGKAVVSVLKNPDETKNRGVYVQDAAPTLTQLKAIAEKITGTVWKGTEVSVENDVLAPALAELEKENPDPSKSILPLAVASIWGKGYGCHFQDLDNEILGLKELTEAEIEALMAATLK